ncbi:glycoside hydrolase family 16 protein [Athelia psychrophila]|uniref:Glycoside hydrolase family 16 protein n=1 Tax=Athelia psychrophila TaxID=1759441 RepID=A0A166FBD5_9AGAM|nr:glycoside hydrolase family 16 protein [Fibularhizoctonia sp. CBS 109695]
MPIYSLLCILPFVWSSFALQVQRRGSSPPCQPFHSTFPAGSVSASRSLGDSSAFVAISPEGSYRAGSNGLELFMQKPEGGIVTRGGVNNKVADGATVNSTFTFLYGKVTYEVSSPLVAGAVTAVILIADQGDEMDVELLGGDRHHWQTNMFAPNPADKQPLWGAFSSVEDVPRDGSVSDFHSYAIDWSPDRIIWSVDGESVRTLVRAESRKNGELHYPSHPVRLSMGIWDASTPVGTAAWSKGPINWNTAPDQMAAVVKSVTLECLEA